MITCQICNQEFKTRYALSLHITSSHKINAYEYFTQFLAHTQSDYLCACGKPLIIYNFHGKKSKTCGDVICHQNSIKKTSKERFGVDNYAKTQECQEKKRKTCLLKYGVDVSSKSQLVKEKTKKNTFLKYNNQWHTQQEDIIQKIKISTFEKYGTNSVLSIQEVKENGMLRKYGVTHNSHMQSWKHRMQQSDVKEKRYATKKANQSFHTSKPEEKFYKTLCNIYGEDDILRQYKDPRYPFACDFYIKSLDGFIELNLHWTHGGELFNEQNIRHLIKLGRWRQKAKTNKYYQQAIQTWTVRDTKKHQIAINNKLNLQTIYTN